jgi:hypothetical protein
MESEHVRPTKPLTASILLSIRAATDETEIGPLVTMARQTGTRRVARLGQRKPGTDLAANDFPQKIACGQALAHAIFFHNFLQPDYPIVRLRSEGTAD